MTALWAGAAFLLIWALGSPGHKRPRELSIAERIAGLSRGDRGEDVLLLQSLLVDRGFEIAVDGIFGAETEEAIGAFQIAEGLIPTGAVDGITPNSLAYK